MEEALILATRIVIMHAHPGRIVAGMLNPLREASTHLSPSELRIRPEFIHFRQQLIASIHP